MTVRFRLFAPRDLDALYAISLATGHLGKDAAQLYDDPCLMGHIYAAPYALLEPGLALVAEEEGEVGGFAVGVLDTSAWEQRLEREWWPNLRKVYLDPVDVEPRLRNFDQRRAFMIHHPALAPASIKEAYPAHLHLNLAPGLQGRGIGSRLFGAWLDLARNRVAEALHIAVNRENPGALRFWRKHAFPADAPQGRTQWLIRDQVPAIQDGS